MTIMTSPFPPFRGLLDACPSWCAEPAGHDTDEADPRNGSVVRHHCSAEQTSAADPDVRLQATRVVQVAEDGATTVVETNVIVASDAPFDVVTIGSARRMAGELLALADLAEIGQ